MSEMERHAARPAPCRSNTGQQIDLLITRRMECWDLASCLLIWHQYVGKRKPEQGCLSWLNVRRHQKYKSEENCQEEPQLNSARHERLLQRSERLPRPSPNARL